jgi:hypothetical protein
LWDKDLSACSLTLPKWGSMRDGVLLELLTLEHRTAANDAGLWPTPNVPNGGRSCAHVNEWSESGKTAYHNGKKVQVGLEHAAKNWPTPTASLGTKGGRVTPRKSREGGTLIEAVSARKTWPTPTVNDSKNCTLPPSQVKHDNIPGALLRDGEKAGGALNPMWGEWLMGWPLGWTDLKPLEMDRCRNVQQRHGGF